MSPTWAQRAAKERMLCRAMSQSDDSLPALSPQDLSEKGKSVSEEEEDEGNNGDDEEDSEQGLALPTITGIKASAAAVEHDWESDFAFPSTLALPQQQPQEKPQEQQHPQRQQDEFDSAGTEETTPRDVSDAKYLLALIPPLTQGSSSSSSTTRGGRRATTAVLPLWERLSAAQPFPAWFDVQSAESACPRAPVRRLVALWRQAVAAGTGNVAAALSALHAVPALLEDGAALTPSARAFACLVLLHTAALWRSVANIFAQTECLRKGLEIAAAAATDTAAAPGDAAVSAVLARLRAALAFELATALVASSAPARALPHAVRFLRAAILGPSQNRLSLPTAGTTCPSGTLGTSEEEEKDGDCVHEEEEDDEDDSRVLRWIDVYRGTLLVGQCMRGRNGALAAQFFRKAAAIAALIGDSRLVHEAQQQLSSNEETTGMKTETTTMTTTAGRSNSTPNICDAAVEPRNAMPASSSSIALGNGNNSSDGKGEETPKESEEEEDEEEEEDWDAEFGIETEHPLVPMSLLGNSKEGDTSATPSATTSPQPGESATALPADAETPESHPPSPTQQQPAQQGQQTIPAKHRVLDTVVLQPAQVRYPPPTHLYTLQTQDGGACMHAAALEQWLGTLVAKHVDARGIFVVRTAGAPETAARRTAACAERFNRENADLTKYTAKWMARRINWAREMASLGARARVGHRARALHARPARARRADRPRRRPARPRAPQDALWPRPPRARARRPVGCGCWSTCTCRVGCHGRRLPRALPRLRGARHRPRRRGRPRARLAR